MTSLFTRKVGSPAHKEVCMSQVRVHNFSISLDGFGTGEGQSLDAPFGHAATRLHDWFFEVAPLGRTGSMA